MSFMFILFGKYQLRELTNSLAEGFGEVAGLQIHQLQVSGVQHMFAWSKMPTHVQ